MSRTAAREVSMKRIYEIDLNKQWNENIIPLNIDLEIFESFVNEEDELNNSDIEYINTIINGVEENRTEIDNLIEKNSKSWKLNRFSKVDLSILRISVFEILFMKDIPHQVSINEAVRIAKKYGTYESSKFINGILGGIVKNLGIE